MSARSPAPCATMRACWRVVAGHDPDDSTTSEKPVPDYEALLEGGVAGLRIGLVAARRRWRRSMPQVGAAIQAAADALGKLGAKITPATMPDFTALYRSAEVMVKCEAAAMHRPWMEADAPYANQVRTRMEAGFFIPATQYIDALRLRAHFVREFLDDGDGRRRCRAAAGHPLPHPDHRGDRRREVGRTRHAQAWWRASPASHGPSTRSACRRCRCPAASTANGAPIGLQLIGRPFDEALLYRIGHAYQGATEHHKKVPV